MYWIRVPGVWFIFLLNISFFSNLMFNCRNLCWLNLYLNYILFKMIQINSCLSMGTGHLTVQHLLSYSLHFPLPFSSLFRCWSATIDCAASMTCNRLLFMPHATPRFYLLLLLLLLLLYFITFVAHTCLPLIELIVVSIMAMLSGSQLQLQSTTVNRLSILDLPIYNYQHPLPPPPSTLHSPTPPHPPLH